MNICLEFDIQVTVLIRSQCVSFEYPTRVHLAFASVVVRFTLSNCKMEIKRTALEFATLVFYLVQVNGDTMICRGLSDDILPDGGHSGTQEKVRGLEEQVRQLRKLVEKKTDISVHTTIEGLPRGM